MIDPTACVFQKLLFLFWLRAQRVIKLITFCMTLHRRNVVSEAVFL